MPKRQFDSQPLKNRWPPNHKETKVMGGEQLSVCIATSSRKRSRIDIPRGIASSSDDGVVDDTPIIDQISTDAERRLCPTFPIKTAGGPPLRYTDGKSKTIESTGSMDKVLIQQKASTLASSLKNNVEESARQVSVAAPPQQTAITISWQFISSTGVWEEVKATEIRELSMPVFFQLAAEKCGVDTITGLTIIFDRHTMSLKLSDGETSWKCMQRQLRQQFAAAWSRAGGRESLERFPFVVVEPANFKGDESSKLNGVWHDFGGL